MQEWQKPGHIAKRTDNCWRTRIMIWYPRGIKRPSGHPNLRWDHDIRRQAFPHDPDKQGSPPHHN